MSKLVTSIKSLKVKKERDRKIQELIEGSIEYQLQIEYNFDPPGVFAGFTLSLKGHGTGDLKGAIFDAVGGPLIMHGGTVTPATHDGTVRGWPT